MEVNSQVKRLRQLKVLIVKVHVICRHKKNIKFCLAYLGHALTFLAAQVTQLELLSLRFRKEVLSCGCDLVQNTIFFETKKLRNSTRVTINFMSVPYTNLYHIIHTGKTKLQKSRESYRVCFPTTKFLFKDSFENFPGNEPDL